MDIEIRGVSKVFSDPKRGTVCALEDIDLHIYPGEIFALVGPSGCGKSTLLNLVAGFDTPSSGMVLVGGQRVEGPTPDRGVVFQEHGLFPWLTVLQNVRFGPMVRGNRPQLERSREIIRLVGLAGFEHHYPRELSGGMRQRVALARVLVNEPKVLLMDEPFGALDSQTRLAMQELLLELWERVRVTILFITHDVDEAIFLADRIAVLSARPGRLKAEFRVGLPRPRDYRHLTSASFAQLKAAILEELRTESTRALNGASGREVVGVTP